MKRLYTDDYSELTETDRQYLIEDIVETCDIKREDVTDEDIYDRFMTYLEFDGEDMEDILNKIDKENINNGLIAIADLGLWNGRKQAYRELDSLTDISSCMEDYNTMYVERNDLKIRATHHDGTNYITIREFKDISDAQKENFLNKIYYGKATQKDVSRYTKAIGKTVYDNYYL